MFKSWPRREISRAWPVYPLFPAPVMPPKDGVFGVGFQKDTDPLYSLYGHATISVAKESASGIGRESRNGRGHVTLWIDPG